ENLVSAALKRALRNGETSVVPRISDLPAVVASTAGKIELESVGEISEERVIDRLVQRSILNVFNRTFSLVEFDALLAAFQRGALQRALRRHPLLALGWDAASRRARGGGAARRDVGRAPLRGRPRDRDGPPRAVGHPGADGRAQGSPRASPCGEAAAGRTPRS